MTYFGKDIHIAPICPQRFNIYRKNIIVTRIHTCEFVRSERTEGRETEPSKRSNQRRRKKRRRRSNTTQHNTTITRNTHSHQKISTFFSLLCVCVCVGGCIKKDHKDDLLLSGAQTSDSSSVVVDVAIVLVSLYW